MSKFAKKSGDVSTKSEAKEKVWTNDPDLQENGVTTEKGKQVRKEISARTGKSQGTESGEDIPGFAKKSKSPAKRESSKEQDNRKITLIEKKNPKREGSKGYKRYALYKSGMKVVDFLEAGGTSADLRYDEAKGFIKIA